ncbi:MAG: UvrD-helicase domain-containing protein, partial [Pseudomonadota bacterium]
MSLDDATRAQRRAARPGYSTWLVANAGSGKTKVLTERVARLLLAGVEPQRILCLTYTKAAASEMQNRLFRTLGSWTMLGNGRLAEELAGLGEPGPFPDDLLAQARTLFARAVETPGGLKIQTIHSFCSTVLRRFPLEAGVSPDFKEMDDRLAKLLQREVLEELAIAQDPGMTAMARYQSGEELDKWLGQVVRQKQALTQPKTRPEVFQEHGIPNDLSMDAVCAKLRASDVADLVHRVGTALQAAGSRDQQYGQKLRDADFSGPPEQTLIQLETAMLNAKGEPRGTWFPTKTARKDVIAADEAAYDA